jgi:SAM-dependent methyltransferase
MASVIQLAHAAAAAFIQPGMTVLDATAGNGHDTLRLAQCVGAGGRVYAVDIQPAAIAATRARLQAHGCLDRVELRLAAHEQPAAYLPPELHGRLALAMFNLGYLPGGAHALTTRGATTVQALAALLPWLARPALLLVTCYPGHPEGQREAQMVEAWLREQRPLFADLQRQAPGAPPTQPPILHMARLAGSGASTGGDPSGTPPKPVA